MTIESTLSRELDIRFIDAKRLVNEAKVSLNMCGYVEKEHWHMIQAEASRLFSQQTVSDQSFMHKAHWELESIKATEGSYSLSEWQDAGSVSGDISKSSDHSSTSTTRSTSSAIHAPRRGLARSFLFGSHA
eukprot:Nitzschia sp. Nitz4//scaffold130_size63480//31325//31717//NITZ4_006249-RA/size63480-processed-gene-0.17-mRNA-1//1//CDS//3329535189//8930//frame0